MQSDHNLETQILHKLDKIDFVSKVGPIVEIEGDSRSRRISDVGKPYFDIIIHF